MARVVAERTWRPSTPEAIEPNLAALWRELAQGDVRIARAVMSNLVVFRDRMITPDAGIQAIARDLLLDEVAARHPSRLIVLEHEHGQSDACAPPEAGVGIVTFGPPQARYGVEQIVVRSSCAETSLSSIVRRYIRGDVPTTVWWTEDLSRVPPLRALILIGRQVLYDSRDWRDARGGFAALVPLLAETYLDMADLNWRRLTPLRRALEHVGGPIDADSWHHQAGVRITHRRGDESISWLLAGWLLAAGGRSPEAPLEITESSAAETALTVTLEHGSGTVEATLTDRAVTIAQGSRAPLVTSVPVENAADAVAAELRMLSRDAALHAALGALGRRFAATA